jgi:putative transposase
MTQTITIREGRANVFVAVEHANSEVVGIHASRSANRFEALEPVRQGVHRCFGAIAPGVARGLKLRHDHGSNYMSGDFQDEIECLGIEASPSFVRRATGTGARGAFVARSTCGYPQRAHRHGFDDSLAFFNFAPRAGPESGLEIR